MRLVIGLILLAPMGASGQGGDADRVFVNINALHQCCVQQGNYRFWLSEPLRHLSIDEAATYEARHRLGGAAARDVSARVRLWRNLVIGVGVSTFHTQSQADVVRIDQAGVRYVDPHGGGAPASSIRGLEHRQVGYHIQAAWVGRLTDRFEVTAFGGPSRFRVSYQSVVDESGRYIDSQAMMRSSSRRATGGNYGFDFVFLVTDRFGVGIVVQVAGATIDSPTRGGSGSIRLGGSHLGIGARLRF